MVQNNNRNIFTRILVVLFIIFLAALVLISFFNGNPLYSISAGIITILLLMTILILSEVFDNFNLGKLLSVSREVKEKAREVSFVKKENEHLRTNIIQLTTMVSQIHNQNTTNNNLLFSPDVIKQMLGVVKAEDICDEHDTDELDCENLSNDNNNQDSNIPNEIINGTTRTEQKRLNTIDYRKLESVALSRHIQKYEIPEEEVIKKVQFTQAFADIDPIMERKIIFDGYLKTPTKEIFIEVMRNGYISNHMYYRLYVMISKLMFYRQAKNIQAELILVLLHLPEEHFSDIHNSRMYSSERFIEAFQPAIANGLLRIENVYLNSEDIEQALQTDTMEDESNL